MSWPAWRIAVIGDFAGFLDHLRAALATLGVTASHWPDDLLVIQVGDLLGGRDDLDVVELIAPHVATRRWVQLLGNWELEAADDPQVTNAKGRTADVEALRVFRDWYQDGLVHHAVGVNTESGATGVITHAGISHGFWSQDLAGSTDGQDVVEMIRSMALRQVARPGEMFGGDAETAPGRSGHRGRRHGRGGRRHHSLRSTDTQHHGTRYRRAWWDTAPADIDDHAIVKNGHVIFRASAEALPFVTVDPGLWDRSPVGSLQPLVFDNATLV